MKERIISFLEDVEQKNNIKILYACETGSRAWNTSSEESDYDIRFIYMHYLDWYLSISGRKDNMDFFENTNLDFVGWELRKTLLMLRKSDANIFECLESPIVYKKDLDFYAELKKIANDYFSLKTTAYHYINKAESVFEDEVLGKTTVSLKNFLQLLHNLLCAKWITEQKDIPPVILEDLLVLLQNNINLMHEAKQLIKQKTNAKESNIEVNLDDHWTKWIESEIENLKALMDFLSAKKSGDEKLNQFFRSIILAK